MLYINYKCTEGENQQLPGMYNASLLNLPALQDTRRYLNNANYVLNTKWRFVKCINDQMKKKKDLFNVMLKILQINRFSEVLS